MTDNPVRDLLDSVSSGQPPMHLLSANDLVRAGRQRQRRVALAAAGGTAVVVTGAAGLLSHTVLRNSSGQVGVASAPRSATTAQPDPSDSAGSETHEVTTTLAVISAAHVLSDGTQVGTFVRTAACSVAPGLRVVSEDQHEVVLSLGVRIAKGGLVVRPSASTDALCPPRLAGSPATGAAVGSSFEAVAKLKAPLADRRLVDQATGNVIPYTTDTQTAYASWVPDGWHDVTGVRPVDLKSWEQDWATPDNGLLSLRQTFDAPDDLGGHANAEVNGGPAHVVRGKNFLTATWWAAGRRYDLTVSDVHVCSAQELATPGGCRTPSDVVLPMSQADLLRVADGVKAR